MRKHIGPLAQYGDTRIREVFAWFPTRIGVHSVWLERYRVVEQFIRGMPCDGWSELRKELI